MKTYRTHLVLCPRSRSISIVMPILALVLMVSLCCFETTAQPFRMAVTAESRSVRFGQNATLTCTLLDKDNKRVPAQRDLNFILEAKSQSGAVTNIPVAIKAGQEFWSVVLPMSQPGILQITPRNTRLLNRGTSIIVQENLQQTVSPTSGHPQATPRVASPEPQRRNFLSKLLAGFGFKTPEDAAIHVATNEILPRVSAALGGKPGLILVCGNDRHLADGEDAAPITVFLNESSQAASSDITVTLVSSSGKLGSTHLVIKKGTDSASTDLTSSAPGDVEVRYLTSKPHLEVQGPTNISVHFSPAITTAHAEFNPVSTSLLGRSAFVVTLQNKDGKSLSTDEDCRVSLALSSGAGKLARDEIIIPKGSFRSSDIYFNPTQRGTNSIRADAEDLVSSTALLTVTFPVLLLCFSVVGGSIGGAVAFVSGASSTPKKVTKWQRIGIGVITGFVFYWAVIFLNLFVRISPETALNPLCALALSILGGFAGIKVLAMILGPNQTPPSIARRHAGVSAGEQN